MLRQRTNNTCTLRFLTKYARIEGQIQTPENYVYDVEVLLRN